MTSEQKLKEMRFFLEMINQFYQDDEKCEYCISAFLHASYDLIDHTLEEYRQHFRINVPDHEQKRISAFIETAKKQAHADAIGFIRLYIIELQKIYTNPITAPLLIIRNSNTHSQTNLTPAGTFTEHSDGRIEFDKKCFLSDIDVITHSLRNDLKGYVCNKTKSMQRHAKNLDVDLPAASLEDLSQIYDKACVILLRTDIRKVCATYLETLTAFVLAIRAKYPRWP